MVENGIEVSIVGKRVVEALNDGEFYIFTHPNYRPDYARDELQQLMQHLLNPRKALCLNILLIKKLRCLEQNFMKLGRGYGIY